MVNIPPALLGNEVATVRTTSLLPEPERFGSAVSIVTDFPLFDQALLEIELIGQVVGVGLLADFDMPLNRYGCRTK